MFNTKAAAMPISREREMELRDDVDELAARLLVAWMSYDDGSGQWGDDHTRTTIEGMFKWAEVFVAVRERRRGRL